MKNRRQPYEETTETRHLGLQLFYSLWVKLHCFMIHHHFKTCNVHISGSSSRLSYLPPLPWTAHQTRAGDRSGDNIWWPWEPFAFLQWWFIGTRNMICQSWLVRGCSGDQGFSRWGRFKFSTFHILPTIPHSFPQFSIPHFTFRIPRSAIPHFTHSQQSGA